MSYYSAEIALNRFGLGANPGQLAHISADPKAWLMNQLNPLHFVEGLTESNQAIQLFAQYQIDNKQAKKSLAERLKNVQMQADEQATKMQDPAGVTRRQLIKNARQQALATLSHAISTDNSFQARLLDFFSNHFSVTGDNFRMKALAPILEREAIAPHLTGYFADLLIAVEQHPTMLIYLNNELSIGPDSKIGKKRTNKGLNENLAREILELHSLGVKGGYRQQDVRELAMAITGWTVAFSPKDKKVGFVFRQQTHQPGNRTILNKTYKQNDIRQGETILADLAVHPSTAKHICFKLARHFVADQPPEALIDAMVATWLKSSGHLKQVLITLIEHPLSWQPTQQKFKTPREFVISACRACNTQITGRFGLLEVLNVLGHAPFNAGSPAGYGDNAQSWDGGEAIMSRIEWADNFSRRVKGMPLEIAQHSLGKQLSDRTKLFIKRAESRQQAIAMLLMSPEFQRR